MKTEVSITEYGEAEAPAHTRSGSNSTAKQLVTAFVDSGKPQQAQIPVANDTEWKTARNRANNLQYQATQQIKEIGVSAEAHTYKFASGDFVGYKVLIAKPEFFVA